MWRFLPTKQLSGTPAGCPKIQRKSDTACVEMACGHMGEGLSPARLLLLPLSIPGASPGCCLCFGPLSMGGSSAPPLNLLERHRELRETRFPGQRMKATDDPPGEREAQGQRCGKSCLASRPLPGGPASQHFLSHQPRSSPDPVLWGFLWWLRRVGITDH